MRKAALGSITLVCALSLATVAHGYVIDRDGHGHSLHWRSFPVSYLLVAGNNPAGSNGESAIHSAFQTWTAAEPSIQYRFAGYAPQGNVANDGHNTVAWISGNWPFDGALAAVTFRYYDTFDGGLIDVDIMFNGAAFSWSVGGAGYDIENSATHEVGHFGGLGHSSDSTAAMYPTTRPGETSKRTLSGDDVAGIRAIYGTVPTLVSLPQTLVSQAVPAVGATSNGSTNDQFTAGAGGVEGGGGGGGGCSLGAPTAPGGASLAWTVLLLVLFGRRRARCHFP